MTCVEVVIVGAGIAGLAVARSLIANGIGVVVLEARNRVGGRLLSQETADGHRRDLGATWFWPNERRIIELIAELDISVFSQYLAGNAMYHQPGGSQQIDGNPLDVPSGRFLLGADSLPNAMHAELPTGVVRLGHAADSIDFASEHALVASSTATFQARHVVLALPPALATSRITFSPELPDRLRSLAQETPVWMGGTTKVVVTYPEPFWRARGLAGAAISHYGPLREIHDMSGVEGEAAALFGFASGEAGSPTAQGDAVLKQLVDIFGPEAATPLDVLIHDWRGEEFTSPPNVESLGNYQTFGHNLFQSPTMDGRLHWASTETSQENPGHIEGALVAANRAARAVLSEVAMTDTSEQGTHQ